MKLDQIGLQQLTEIAQGLGITLSEDISFEEILNMILAQTTIPEESLQEGDTALQNNKSNQAKGENIDQKLLTLTQGIFPQALTGIPNTQGAEIQPEQTQQPPAENIADEGILFTKPSQQAVNTQTLDTANPPITKDINRSQKAVPTDAQQGNVMQDVIPEESDPIIAIRRSETDELIANKTTTAFTDKPVKESVLGVSNPLTKEETPKATPNVRHTNPTGLKAENSEALSEYTSEEQNSDQQLRLTKTEANQNESTHQRQIPTTTLKTEPKREFTTSPQIKSKADTELEDIPKSEKTIAEGKSATDPKIAQGREAPLKELVNEDTNPHVIHKKTSKVRQSHEFRESPTSQQTIQQELEEEVGTREVTRREPTTFSEQHKGEVKQLTLRFDSAHLRMRLQANMINVDVRIKEQIQNTMSYLDIQRLSKSLQSLGLSLEGLRINGTELFTKNTRSGRREDKERYYIEENRVEEKASHSSANSTDFNLFL